MYLSWARNVASSAFLAVSLVVHFPVRPAGAAELSPEGGAASVMASSLEELPNKLESQVKAGFIVKFAAFIEWPAGTNADLKSPFVIGILGKDPSGKGFDEAVKPESVKGRPVELRRSNEVEKLTDCQIVFVANSEMDRLEEIIRSLADKSVLLITDEPGGVQQGSMINFFKENGKVRFEFNLTAAERARLRFSAKLLQAGKVAVPRQTEGKRNI